MTPRALRQIAAFAGGALLVTSGAAFAQARGRPEDGTSHSMIDDRPLEQRDAPDVNPDPMAAQAMRNFAACVVRRNPGAAEKLLDLDYRTPDYAATLRRMAKGHSDCASRGKLRFNGILLAGGIAETLLLRAGYAGLPSQLAFRPGSAPIIARGPMEATGLCVARGAPSGVAALLQTTPMSDAEGRAMASITPLLQGCVAKGQTLRLNRPGLRSIVALAAYRITHMPAAGS